MPHHVNDQTLGAQCAKCLAGLHEKIDTLHAKVEGLTSVTAEVAAFAEMLKAASDSDQPPTGRLE